MDEKSMSKSGLAYLWSKLKVKLAELAEAVLFRPVSITIPATGWRAGASGPNTVYRDVSASITARDGCMVDLDAASLAVAQACGLSASVETRAGALRFRAVSAPTANMTGELRVLRGPAE